MILAIKTDAPDATVAVMDRSGRVAAERTWTAGRELSAQLLTVIAQVLQEAQVSQSDLTRVAVYEGPGSYTGLRIGISVANAMAFSHDIPVVGVTGNDWLQQATQNQADSGYVAPVYGGEANITLPRK